MDEALLHRWQSVPVAVVVDIDPKACQIDPNIRPLKPPGTQPGLFGRAVTAKCQPPDFGSVLKAADAIKPGDVLVIDASGNSETAMIGEIVSGLVKRNGGVGLVCDGAIRDVAELSKWSDFSVFTRHITPCGPDSAGKFELQLAVNIGGQ
ncbi:MAG: RraA family protein, partial [Pseudomonadota bacterium]